MAETAEDRGRIWLRILAYVVLVAALTALTTVFVTHADLPRRLKAFIGMWMPGTSGIVVKLIFDRSLKGLGLDRTGGKWLLIGLFLPVAYALPVYGLTWATGQGGFDASRWAEAVPYFPHAPTALAALGLLLTVGLVDKLGRALGEEIGWRGFLVPECLKIMPLWVAGLFTGAIWWSWHLPAILLGDYHSAGPSFAYQIACFAVMVIPSGILYAWVRQGSVSVWPCALMHASHNLFIQSVLDQATVNGPKTPWITGEFGFGLAITSTITVLVVLAMRRKAAGAVANA
jgi:membrane protease YdiL (CAAX protease family)